MDYQVILSPRAIQDLQEIVRYISFDSPASAEKFGLALIEQAHSLRTFPERGRVVPEFRNKNIRGLFSEPIESFTASRPTATSSRFRVSGMAHEERRRFCKTA